MIIVETIPHQDTFRNETIKTYNGILAEIVEGRDNCHLIRVFNEFLASMPIRYLDRGHPDDAGNAFIAGSIRACLDDLVMKGEAPGAPGNSKRMLWS